MTSPQKDKNDIVLIGAKRTPFTKAFKGAFFETQPDILLTQLIQKTLASCNVSANEIKDVIFANVLVPQGGVIEARVSCLKAGISVETPVMTINRQCAGGLEVLKMIGKEEITLVGGFECMSKFGLQSEFYVSDYCKNKTSWNDLKNGNDELNEKNENYNLNEKNKENKNYNKRSEYIEFQKIDANEKNNFVASKENVKNEIKNYNFNIPKEYHQFAFDCTLPMGITSENITERFNLTREEIDKYAYESHLRSFKAQENKIFDKEIVPILIKKNNEIISISKDDGVRKPDFEKLKTLKPVFKENGCSTAGNSSQLSDGASALLFCTREYAIKNNKRINLILKDVVSVGVEPAIMGIGPVPAIKKLLVRNNLRIEDIEFFEINEAFASQALICMKELGIKHEKYNVNGGALGIGHPVGASGGRLVCSLLNAMDPIEYGFGIVSMCAATGMGTAALFYKERN
ncbi:3-ketoacyl-CoA thiolase [Gurleya vavrai]